MATKSQTFVTDMFEQAVDTFDAAMKAGVKAQEEATKWWSDLLGDAGSVQDWQRKAASVAGDVLPAAQKNAEEYLHVLEQNARNSMELLKKAFETGQSESVADLQAKTQKLWEASLATLRTNTQTVVQANAKALESLTDFARKNGNAKPAAAGAK